MALHTKQPGGETRDNVRVSGRAPGDKFSGLISIDGVKVSASALSSLQPKDISSVEVLKGEAAAKVYSDPAAANGVIVVKTVRGSR